MKLPKYILIAIIYSFVLIPTIFATEVNFGELVIADDVSPEVRFAKKLDLTSTALDRAIEKVNDMRAGLEKVKLDEETPQSDLRNQFLTQTEEYLNFYKERSNSLSSITTLEEVNSLIDEIIDYREGTYVPGAKNILEYILVFSYTPSVIETAQERFNKINNDLNKLKELELVKIDEFTQSMEETQLTLSQAQELKDMAQVALITKHAPEEELIGTSTSTVEMEPTSTTTPDMIETLVIIPSPKSLAEESLIKVRDLYGLFLTTGSAIEKTLGLGEGSL
jgi:hypothetical protein